MLGRMLGDFGVMNVCPPLVMAKKFAAPTSSTFVWVAGSR